MCTHTRVVHKGDGKNYKKMNYALRCYRDVLCSVHVEQIKINEVFQELESGNTDTHTHMKNNRKINERERKLVCVCVSE